MTRIARTVIESEVYVGLNPCGCGAGTPPGPSAATAPDGRPMLWHDGPCPQCAKPWPAPFGLPLDVPRFGTTWDTFFGGPGPSTLLDPGEWLLVEKQLASGSIPARNADAATITEFRGMITMATAAINETLRFITDPSQYGLVTVDDCWTGRGRAELTARYRGYTWRRRLEAFREGLSGSLMEFGGGLFENVPITGALTLTGPGPGDDASMNRMVATGRRLMR